MSSLLPPINFAQWIEEHRDQLQPPVCNAQVYEDGEFIIMVVGGPNTRKDFHLDPGAEFFYQLEGKMTLRIMEDGAPRDIDIQEGEIFLLPPDVPHSPQRYADTVGLVIERKRREGEVDGLRWYCESCHAPLYEEFFALTDITKQLAPVIQKFHASEELRTCDHCGDVMQVPGA
jgi:3-hydroxyanthranilate 3,4-dioxygenase